MAWTAGSPIATGDLLTELRENRDRGATQIKQAKSAATATVLGASALGIV